MTAQPHHHPPVPVVCASSYTAQAPYARAFVFRVPSTDTRFTVYSTDPDRYHVTGTYLLGLAETGEVPLWLPADEWALLHACLHNVRERWETAIAQADAGASQSPRAPQTSGPDQIDTQPTPTGYQRMARVLRAELDRVRRLIERVDHLLDTAEDPGGR